MRYCLLFAALITCIHCQPGEDPGVDAQARDSVSQKPAQSAMQVPANVQVVQLGIPATARQEPGKLYPVDEGVRSEGFNRFRSALLHAITRRDTSFVMDLVDAESKISFGGEGGKDAFRIMWGLGQSYRTSELWEVLDMVVRMGGQFDPEDPELFIAPYVYAAWPNDKDAFRNVAITGSNVRVRSEPHLEAEVLARLSYDIVGYEAERTAEADTVAGMIYPWYEVTLAGGRKGWVFGRYIRSPIDFRAGFKRVGDYWKLTFLVAGD